MTGDTRLAGQALRQFARSVRPDGLTASRYPSRVPQIIPLWSLHWILAVREYTAYTGDAAVGITCLSAMLSVLEWFWAHRQPDGLIGKLPGWMVADWSPDWPGGVPPGAECGASAMVQCMAIGAADAVASMAEAGTAAIWRDAAAGLRRLVNRAFWDDERGCFRDRPDGGGEASRLTNAWAMLAGVANGDRLARVADALVSAEGLCREAWFGRNFVFDALLLAGRFADAETLLEPFRELLGQGFTTWPEDLGATRSECHGWSNLPGVAMRQLYLGVRMMKPGGKHVVLQPWCGSLTFARRTVPLPTGTLYVSWRREGDNAWLKVEAPSEVLVELCPLPDGLKWVII